MVEVIEDGIVRSQHLPPKHQADAILNQANPVSGTLYTVLDTTKNVRIIGIAVRVIWTVQVTLLEIHITIDGQTMTFDLGNPASNTYYYAEIDIEQAPADQNLFTTDYALYKPFLLEGRSIKIEAEVTGGTASNLTARVKYAKW